MAQARRTRRPISLHGRAARRTLLLAVALAALVLINLYVFLWRGGTSLPDVMKQAAVAGEHQPPPPGPAPAVTPGGAPVAPGGEAPAGAAAAAEDEGRWVEGTVQAGDSLGGILRREGLTPPEADQLLRTLRPVMDFRGIRAGQTYRIRFDDRGGLVEFEYVQSRVSTVRAVRGADGGLTAAQVKAETESRVTEVSGVVDSSLYASVKAAGEDTSLVGFFVDVFAYDINFYIDTHPGDTFRMLVEKVYLDGHFLHYGRVLAAEYAGKVGRFRVYSWQAPGAKSPRYYDEQGRSIEKTFLKSPLKYTRVSSGFNPRRMHPILHRIKGHFGTDYAAPIGTPVWAAAGGKITYRGPKGGAGNCVMIDHGNGLQTIYMHLSRFQKGQAAGMKVAQKTVIGYVGMTGLATGPHLHFGVKRNGHYVDVLRLKLERSVGVAKAELPRFRRDVTAWQVRLDAVAVAKAPAPAAEADSAPHPIGLIGAAASLPE